MAFLAVEDGTTGAKVRVRGGKLSVDQPRSSIKYVIFDNKEFVVNTEVEVRKAYHILKRRGATDFRIMAGPYLVYQTKNEDLLVEKVLKYVNDYGLKSVSKWLLGIQGILYKQTKKVLEKDTTSLLKRFREWNK